MKKKKVLLVDDVRLFLKLEETFFKRAGCEILTAQSGGSALDLAGKHFPDLILLDFIMPDIMGDEVCRRLKATPATKGIPIIMVSTSADPGDIEKCFRAGATEYVTKPINAQDILAKAANILNIPQRIHYRLPITLRVVGAAAGQSFQAMSRNLSQGGILLECDHPLAAEALVSLDLPILPAGATINFQGQAMRVDQDLAIQNYLVGVQFLDLTSAQEKALLDFIRQHQDKEKTA